MPDTSLIRIAKTTYVNALTDIFGKAAVDAVRSTIDALPSGKAGTFSTELAPPSYVEVQSYVDIASAVAFEVTKDQKSLAALRPCLGALVAGVNPTTDTCLGQFTADMGRRLMRKPLSVDDTQRFLQAYSLGGKQSAAEGVATLLTTMLVDTGFLYFLEVDGAQSSPGVFKLTPYETAARVARALWDSVPDAELQSAADAGLAADALAKQMDRMWKSPRTRPNLRRFFSEWFDMEKLPYPPTAFAADSTAQASLRTAMVDDLLAFSERVLFDRDGSYSDLLLDRSATVTNATLSKIYGLAPGSGMLPDSRAGLLTRAGWLGTQEISGSNAGHVIKRGVKLAHFICRDLPPPDPNLFPAVNPASPAAGPTLNIRQRFQKATAEPQCSSCHTIIDSFGGPFGQFGAAGQWIDAETVTSGNTTRMLPIDASSKIVLGGKETAVAGAADLSRAVAQSDAGPECMARLLVENIQARSLNTGDGCLVQSALDVLANPRSGPGSMRAALFAIIASPGFVTGRLATGGAR